jgi:hypothetical protein
MRKFQRIACCLLCLAVVATTLIMTYATQNEPLSQAETTQTAVLTLWQIDTFEGGKGSRASYLKTIGNEFYQQTGTVVLVNSLSSDAALQNLKEGKIPDLISFGAGTAGLENYLAEKPIMWCNGSYCYLTTDLEADFSDVNEQNTVVNMGKENLASVAALLSGLSEAKFLQPTEAYLQLINQKAKYLLGTQRDVQRLITREVSFQVKPISIFNDLYQLIAVTDAQNDVAKKYVDFLITQYKNLQTLGLFYEDKVIYDEEPLSKLQGNNFEYVLDFPLSQSAKEELQKIIQNKEINNLKMYLKSLKK